MEIDQVAQIEGVDSAPDIAAVGRLTRVALRKVWPHEALDFTRWLQENLDVLNEHLDTPLESAEREQSAGSFSVDLVAEDADGSTVVIENQLGKTDHDHLGKLLTYLAAFDASRAIWIAADPRPEHVKAIAWLNDSTPSSFHLFKVEAVQIGSSPPAPLLTPIVGPSAESKMVAQTKQEYGERHKMRLEFWGQLLALSKDKTKLFSGVSPSRHPYISTGAGMSGVSYQYWVRQEDSRCVLWIDRGKEQADANLALFESLQARREEIESSFEGELNWDSMEDSRACKIVAEFPASPGWRTPSDERAAGMLELIESMVRLERALRPHLQSLSVS